MTAAFHTEYPARKRWSLYWLAGCDLVCEDLHHRQLDGRFPGERQRFLNSLGWRDRDELRNQSLIEELFLPVGKVSRQFLAPNDKAAIVRKLGLV